MEVVPVIDVKRGAVVRARLGQRASYAPIVTPLAATSKPVDVVAGFLRLYPFRTIYVADLDAIEREGSGDDTIARLRVTFPQVTFWVDPGVRDSVEARGFLERHARAHLVLGAESLVSLEPLAALAGNPRLLLSLDFDGARFLGPRALLEAPDLWPARVIVMTLARVGSDAGPDFDRLSAVAGLAPRGELYAAGGLRGNRDLLRLEQAGVAGVLVASALHDGRLCGTDLEAVMAKSGP